jgi:hypothetical protein
MWLENVQLFDSCNVLPYKFIILERQTLLFTTFPTQCETYSRWVQVIHLIDLRVIKSLGVQRTNKTHVKYNEIKMEKVVPSILIYWYNLLKLLIFKKEHKQCTKGNFWFTVCHSNEKNLNYISCNVPRLNVVYLTLKKAHVEKKKPACVLC